MCYVLSQLFMQSIKVTRKLGLTGFGNDVKPLICGFIETPKTQAPNKGVGGYISLHPIAFERTKYEHI